MLSVWPLRWLKLLRQSHNCPVGLRPIRRPNVRAVERCYHHVAFGGRRGQGSALAAT